MNPNDMLIFSGGISTRSVQGSLLLYVVQINCTNLRDDVDFLTKLKTLEIRFLAIIFFLAILVQDMVVMGKVYPKMYIYIYIIDNIYMYNTSFYHISFVRPFIIFKETPTSSVLPFRFSILGVFSTTSAAASPAAKVVVTCQMIVTSHGGGRMSCILKGGEITEGNTSSTGSWQICCWTMVFM